MKIAPSLFIVKVSPSRVPIVRPAPCHCMLSLFASCLYVALTSRLELLPEGSANRILLVQLPSGLIVNVPEVTRGAPPWCGGVYGRVFPLMVAKL